MAEEDEDDLSIWMEKLDQVALLLRENKRFRQPQKRPLIVCGILNEDDPRSPVAEKSSKTSEDSTTSPIVPVDLLDAETRLSEPLRTTPDHRTSAKSERKSVKLAPSATLADRRSRASAATDRVSLIDKITTTTSRRSTLEGISEETGLESATTDPESVIDRRSTGSRSMIDRLSGAKRWSSITSRASNESEMTIDLREFDILSDKAKRVSYGVNYYEPALEETEEEEEREERKKEVSEEEDWKIDEEDEVSDMQRQRSSDRRVSRQKRLECMRFLDVDKFAEEFVDGIIVDAEVVAESVQPAAKAKRGSSTKLSTTSASQTFIGWPTISEFTVILGAERISEYFSVIESRENWYYIVTYINTTRRQAGKIFHYTVKWSLPTPRYPIVQAYAVMYFDIEVSYLVPVLCPVKVSYWYEGNSYRHDPTTSVFNDQMLNWILDQKLRFFKTLVY